MDKVFTVRYFSDGSDNWEDVFPGLTGDYDWAQKVASGTWNRDGLTITPEVMRIFEVCHGVVQDRF
jgi:hypothetical protein